MAENIAYVMAEKLPVGKSALDADARKRILSVNRYQKSLQTLAV